MKKYKVVGICVRCLFGIRRGWNVGSGIDDVISMMLTICIIVVEGRWGDGGGRELEGATKERFDYIGAKVICERVVGYVC